MHNLDVKLNLEIILKHILVCKKRFNLIKTHEDFVSTEQGSILLDSIVIRLQAIGELMKKISQKKPELFNSYPEINWKNIIRFRDFISHHYDMLDYEIVFEICKNNLPQIESVIIKELI